MKKSFETIILSFAVLNAYGSFAEVNIAVYIRIKKSKSEPRVKALMARQ